MLSKKEVEKIAELARLGLAEKEKDKFAEDLSSVLDYVNKLSELDVSNVEPMTGGTSLKNRLRSDEGGKDPADDKMKQDILKQAPDRQDNYFKVPSILK